MKSKFLLSILIAVISGCLSMPNKSEQDFKSLVESKKVIGTESSPLVFNRAELEGVNLSDVHFENVIFNDLALLQVRLDRAYFKNVIFNSCVSLKWRFDYATMDNVIFNKCKLRNFNPMGVTFVNTSFNRTSTTLHHLRGPRQRFYFKLKITPP
ncbi:MAG: pentapeptide repeat-containing protein [Gammaproteobacteria bacterium]